MKPRNSNTGPRFVRLKTKVDAECGMVTKSGYHLDIPGGPDLPAITTTYEAFELLHLAKDRGWVTDAEFFKLKKDIVMAGLKESNEESPAVKEFMSKYGDDHPLSENKPHPGRKR